ncbi:MAG: hypothetical protein HLUCCO17_14090 [Saliniramus fredricksonii]|uniref:Uncharacterized protein n=1 Tax=Saliniramus fredricksonii TaxID=1653334 RepID=A0A0P7XPW9_9HYPH|nr:hypothetical protein [Saliniramus fredricksonii]KPQ09559.1 MAG: hypothetical protein HLUCCO17_14090 [Saliniramus fredricksonii]SCC80391.1 hypothetical protein GA0071312_1465 [Saliniramus fredricksonii]
MPKIRSPRYPQISLPEAIEKVRSVYDEDHLNTVPKEVMAAHMGYGSLNGKSLGVISAVSKYGLIEGGSSGMKLTDRALSIIAAIPGDPERLEALRSAARGPALFAELMDQFPNGASDAAIKSFLLHRKKFLPSAVDNAIRAYRGTVDFVEKEVLGYDSISEDEFEKEDGTQTPIDTVERQPRKITAGAVAAQTHSEAPFDIGFTKNAIRLAGSLNSQEDVEQVVSALSALKAFLPKKQDPQH